MTTSNAPNMGRMYGECILFWMLENAVDGREVNDLEMQEGSGLPDLEFFIGLTWLIEHNYLDRMEERLH